MDDEMLKRFSQVEEGVLVIVALIIVLVAFMGTVVLITTIFAMVLGEGTKLTLLERANLGVVRETYRTAFVHVAFLALIIILKEGWTARKRLELAARTRDLGVLLERAKGTAR